MQERKRTSILRSSFVVSMMTMISRILGLVRDMVFARFLGAEASADAFFVAFKIPNFFRRLFAEGAFSQAFVPVLAEYREVGTLQAVKNLIDRVAGCLGVSLIAITAFVIVASPVFTAIFGIGFYLNSPDKFWLTSDLLRITFPYLLLISLTGFIGAILNSYDKFAIPAITPVFLNIVLIIAAFISANYFQNSVYVLAWGVLIAGFVQFLFQLPFVARIGLLPHPKVDWGDDSVKKVLRLMAPAIFGVSVSQINLVIDTVLASFLPTGSVSWLYFSDRLVELPLGVFGVGIATVVLPHLSRQYSSSDDKYGKTMNWGLRMVLLVAIPSTVALIVIAKPILVTLFFYGKTELHDIVMSSYSLRAYALGLPAFMLIKVLASGFYSRQDTRTPVKIGIWSMGVKMLLNMCLVLPLMYLFGLGHVGLALSTAGAAMMNAVCLYIVLIRQGGLTILDNWKKFLCQISFAVICMVSVLIVINWCIDDFASFTWFMRVACLFLMVLLGSMAYLVGLYITGVRIKHLRVI